MFKLESYITPLLLSYVDKYIKNFRPEDSQVSLWGGDASFHNLDLRLEVLEQELQLPFSFVSGHIHELLIHVPWTKLASEPITITINTIECILKLRSAESSCSSDTSQRDRQKKISNKRQEVEAPPGYVQSLVNKIVSNIRIYCNNLILKYVEEDIVLSMNVKLLTFESANEKWEPAYTAQVTMRKLITINDLTVCLDKRNASGKIEVYQEPMLYRCSLIMHLLRNYHSTTSKGASTTRLDVYCNSMEFSMTEQQIPMLMRLILLLSALKENEFRNDIETSTEDDQYDLAVEPSDLGMSWASWAWSFVPSILSPTDEEHEEQPVVPTGHTLHIGIYIDNASLSFKVSETSNERGYYSQRKLKYWPILLLRFQGVYTEVMMHGVRWINVSSGISQILLVPMGYCTCSQVDVLDNSPPVEYLSAGSVCNAHKTDSLFDAEALENKGQKKLYNISWDYHMSHVTESTLLDKTPAVAVDYVYDLLIPDDMSNEQLADLGNDYEYSAVSVRTLLRIIVGPFRLRLCAGLIHRMSSLKAAASAYDYAPYTTPKKAPSRVELLPPSEDDYDALNENISMGTVQYTVIAPVIEFHLFDHPFFEATKEHLFKKRKKISSVVSPTLHSLPNLPKITLECQCIDAKVQNPIYIRRLLQTVCQLPDPPKHMFEACYETKSVKLIGFSSRLILPSNRHTTIVIPFNASYHNKEIILPEYWTNSDIPHNEMNFQSDSITVTVTKPKAMLLSIIIDKLMKTNCEDVMSYISSTSLLSDATKDGCLANLELCIEDVNIKKVTTNSTFALDMSLFSIKAFIFDPVEFFCAPRNPTKTSLSSQSLEQTSNYSFYSTREIQQVLFISGPEYNDDHVQTGEVPLFKALIQFPLDPTSQCHPTILMFNLQEIRICIDPLLCQWLLYSPKAFQQKTDFVYEPIQRKTKNVSEGSSSLADPPRRAGTPHESIHSSSDREQIFIPQRMHKAAKDEDLPDLQERVYKFLKKWFTVWKGMLLFGDISQCTIYFPVSSLSAVGSQGIQQAVDEAMTKKNPPDILVITLPHAKIRSAANKQSLVKHIKTLPVKLPIKDWSATKSNFPWSISVSDISCYSWQNGVKLNFLKPISLNATVGLCTKSKTDLRTAKSQTGAAGNTQLKSDASSHSVVSDAGASTSNADAVRNDLGTLGICVHVDITPTNIVMSEIQVCLIASILYGLIEVANNLTPEPCAEPLKSPQILPVISAQSTSASPTILKESTLDSASEQNPHMSINTHNIDGNNVKLTAWIQCTITRFSVEILSYKMEDLCAENFSYIQQLNLKLVVEAEDIVSSLDFQSVYLKIKSKVGSASVQHYLFDSTKEKWKSGPFLGFIMKTREEIAASDRQEDTSFANVIVTRASCQHTHNLWGTTRKSKTKENKDDNSGDSTPTRFITEIVITLQPIDFLLSLAILRSFYMVFEPLLQIPLPSQAANTANISAHVNNKILPLAYLECKGFRIIVPSEELGKKGAAHDVCIFQVENIGLLPEPVNPICRTPLRPDIYQQAARARILNIPGSEIEDRQYELSIGGISLSTSTWEEFDPFLNLHLSTVSHLKTMSENPALEWNLGKGRHGNKQSISLWPIVNKFDILIIIAPAMIYKNDIVCGHSIEVNFTTNIDLSVSLSQVKLASALHHELCSVFELIMNGNGVSKRPKVYLPYVNSGLTQWDNEDSFGTQESYDGFRDSGFETSDLRSSVSLKTKESSQIRKVSGSEKSSNIFLKSMVDTPFPYAFVPLDLLVTAGKISFVLYQFNNGDEKRVTRFLQKKHRPLLKDLDKDKGYDGSEEGSIDERYELKIKKFQPLLFLSLSQPNAFISDLQLGRKIQLSCFDVRIKVSGAEYQPLKGIPNETDFPVNLLETRSGVPNPNTGVSPAFFTLKWSKGISKPSLDIEVAKPMKILCSVSRWSHLIAVKDKLLETLDLPETAKPKYETPEYTVKAVTHGRVLKHQRSVDNYSKFKQIKERLGGITVLNVKFAQIVFTMKTENQTELTLSITRLKNNLHISNRPERITNVVALDCCTLGVTTNNVSRLLLNPWTISTEVCLFWESWQSIDSSPQIQISAESDSIMIDVSPDQLQCLEVVQHEVTEFLNNLSFNTSDVDDSLLEETPKIPPSDKEQHYKDDLRAGAFHFVDSTSNNVDELPLPYQVMFWNKNISAMAWRYPQPRALTKIRVFPVPFKMTTGNQDDHQILCHLEYWSDCHGCYRPYTQFHLSESEMCHLELPQGTNQPAVACTWRVVLSTPNNDVDKENHARFLISPRALAGCIRIDSYFNKVLIPEMTLALHISAISVSLYNHVNKSLPLVMPECVQQFVSDLSFPESQCFLTLTLDNTRAYLASWNFETVAADVSTVTKCNILDYDFLTQQSLIEPFASKLEINVSKTLNVSYISKPIHVKFGASAAHTLAVSAQMWQESFKNDVLHPSINLILMTHYVICNDTNVSLRFGQAGYENILLPSRNYHMYSWRSQKCKQMIRVALEDYRWVWSELFRIDREGTEMFKISNFIIVVTIKSVSATQKQVIFSGQLVICNTLLEHFELKVVDSITKDKDKEFKNSPVHILSGKSTPPSILINSVRKYFLRLRFFGLESAWSGDIPLVANTKCAQPWLVKIPLQERGQFLSIWCRIVIQNFPKGPKMLAILWPLFMVRSNLPINSKVHIETPTLNVHLESTVKGKGEYQQLYCPGTIDHSHQLSFQLDDTPTSNPYVPLNYSLVDQKEFFKKPDSEDINEILSVLSTYDKSSWPYFGDEFENVNFVIEEQPLTHVQVRYQNACQYSSALLVELLPWCLLLNTLGCPIAIILNEKELCRISHHGICTPPKLEETFYLGVGLGGTWNLSLPLQLAKSDWSQTFYMPKITGTIPIDGDIKTVVKCDPYVCVVSISSSIVNEIRLLKISSTHVLTNHMSIQLYGVCFAVPDNGISYDVPKKLEKHAFIISPHLHKDNAGLSIIQWYVIGTNVDANTDYLFYISLSTSPNFDWSCPVRVDKGFMRRSVSVQRDQKSIPIVLVSQEYKGQMYLSLHHDLHPQLLIHNKSGVKLFCAQYCESEGSTVIDDCQNLKWLCNIEDESSMYYTMPAVSQKFPEVLQNGCSECLVLASDPEGDPQGFQWSSPVNVTNLNDQFVRIPFYGDVKVSVARSAHTTAVTIESVSQVEISARDIRVRLSMHESEHLSSSDITKKHSADLSVDNKAFWRVDNRDSETNTTIASTYFSAEDCVNSSSESSLLLNRHQLHPSRSLPTLAENSNVQVEVRKNISTSDLDYNRELSLLPPSNEWNSLKVSVFLKSVNLTLTSDLENGGVEKTEIAAVTCDDIALCVSRNEVMEVSLRVGEIQFDNQLFYRDSYDFPVVLIGQNASQVQPLNSLNVPVGQLISNAQNKTLISVETSFEMWRDTVQQIDIPDMTDIRINVKPLLVYIEDTYITKLVDYLSVLAPQKLIVWPKRRQKSALSLNSILVCIPDQIIFDSRVIAKPLMLRTFTIETIYVLLSVHSSIKLYIALDQSSLQFAKFDKKNLMTTPYRLGHAIAMHYLSGAIFGAGWVVGSLELLGSPGGLARAMGTGLWDFVNMPYAGLAQGPWAFVVGIIQGSASLMKHVTAGTLQSVTKLASSLARNLDRLTLDEEHLKRTEEQRRHRPQGVTQGFVQGLTGLGISLLGAVGGIAHHPLQSVMSDGASPRSLVTGVGLGIVGVFTKPLSGAADLVALTGQGLLQGAGWNSLPEGRLKPSLNHTYSNVNSVLKYSWKFMQPTTKHSILFVTEATSITNFGQYEAVALILTLDALIIVNTDDDISQRILKLDELSGVENASDPTLLTLKLCLAKPTASKPKIDDEGVVEMDPASRARIADYVKNTVGLMNFSDNQSSVHSEISISPDLSGEETSEENPKEQTTLIFYVNPQSRNYFLCLLSLAKQQHETYNFPVF